MRTYPLLQAQLGVFLECRRHPCDVSKRDQVKALFDTIEEESGRLDILVNNAAHQGIGKPFVDMDPEYIVMRVSI